MKRLYNETEHLTDEGFLFSTNIEVAVNDIIRKLIDDGYSIRDANLVASNAVDTVCMRILAGKSLYKSASFAKINKELNG